MKALYPKVTVERQSFKGVKRQVVPNQSMTLKEILRRFVKREALPVEHAGVYEERFGDIEKLKNQDPTVQFERIEEIKAEIAEYERKYQERKKRIKSEMDAAARESILPKPTEEGGTPVKSPPPKGA